MLTLYQEADTTETRMVLRQESVFSFHCHPGLACFKRCCHEATIILSPYDILRLSCRLGYTTGEFLKRHTLRKEESRSRLPLALVKHTRNGGCPFLGPGGCQVYEDRPAACRLFPLAQGSELTPRGVVDHYFLRRLEYCQGFNGEREWTIAAWQADQGFNEFDRPRRPWLFLLLKQAQAGRNPPDHRLLSQFYMMAYDPDAFLTFVLESAFLKAHNLTLEEALPLASDELALLRFNAAYLEYLLFPNQASPLNQALTAALTDSVLA